MTTTTTLTTQIDRTIVDLTIPKPDKPELPQEKSEKSPKDRSAVDIDAESEKTASDREYLEQIMGCGDVRRKVMRLESSGSTESLDSSAKQPAVIPKYIGDNVPVVREVVQSIEDKICGTTVSAIPFAVHKRQPHEDYKEPNVVELEKQILTPADLALEKLIKCELPAEVVKISLIEAMENVGLGLREIEEEVCEKVCEKRKAFEVAEDLSETEKTLEEQVIGLGGQGEVVPGKILAETIEERIDLGDKEAIDSLPRVREVVQDIQRRYPASSLEAKPFSPRKKSAQERKVDVSTIEQQILSDADLILDGLGSKRVPEQKVHSPVSAIAKTSVSIENLEDVCEKKCSKRIVSDMAKANETQAKAASVLEIDDVKSTTAMFLEHESTKFHVAEKDKIEVKYDKVPSKLDDKPKSPFGLVKPIQQEYSDDESDEEFAIPKPQDKTVGQPTPSVAPFIGVGDKSPLKEEEKPKLIDVKDDKAPTKLDDKPKSSLGSVKAIQQEYSDDESDEEFVIPKPQDKTLGQPTLLKDELKPTVSVSKVEERTTTVQSSIHSESTVVKAVSIIQPSDPFSGFEGDKDKSPLKEDIKPKPIELKDDKAPTKLDDKPKSPLASVKAIQQEYSDDESDEEFAIPKPQDKTVGQPTPSVAPFIGVGDKSPLKEEEKPKLIDLKDEKASTKLDDKPKSPLGSVKAIQQEYADDESDEEFAIPKPQDKTVGQPTPSVAPFIGVGDKSPLKEEEKPKLIDLKDEKASTKLDDKPKSPLGSVKAIQQEYANDESDEEFAIPKPQDKTVGQPTPSVAPFIGVGDKSPLKEEEKPKLIDVKDDKAPTKLDDKPKSSLGSVKAIQQEYSDDESDEEFVIPKPQDKTLGQPTLLKDELKPTVSVSKVEERSTTVQSSIHSESTVAKAVSIIQPSDPFSGFEDDKDKSPLKEDIKPKPIELKDDKAPTKLDDKPKSPLASVKPIQQEYSDDESDEEFAIPKPQDKTVGQPTPSVAPFIAVGDKSPLKEEEKPKLIDLKDEKASTKLDDKPKSPLGSVKAIQQEYSDDESDEEFAIPKPQDKTVGQPTPSVAPFIGVGDKSPLKEEEKPKLIDLKDEKASTKLDDKPKSPLGSVKAIQQEYADDESDEEFAIPKPQDKTVGQPTPSVAPFIGVGDKSPLKEEEKPKLIDLKDEKASTKLDDKPKSPLGSVKAIQQEYANDESDEEFAIPKPQDKTVGQPTPSVAPFIGVGDKSPLKEEEKPKLIDVKDDKAPTKLDDKPKSSLGSVKAIQQEYSDDESDEEFVIPKPQDKTLGQPTLLKDELKPTVSVSKDKSPLKEDIKPKPIELKDDKAPTKLDDKPKSPLGSVKAIQQEYSDDESDEEFAIPKPQDKTVGQPTPSVAPFIAVGDKSPLKEEEKPKLIDLKDEKAPTKLDDKPKSPLGSVKAIQQEYSDDESDEEFAIPKPQDKTVGQPTPSVAPFIGVGDKSPLKEEEKPKLIDLKDEKASTKLDDKPKSPLGSVKAIQQEYSDDESDEEFAIPKPQDKTVGQPTPSVAPFIGVGDKSHLKEEEKPKLTDLKDEKAPTKLDDKPKSPLGSVKAIQQEYADDESDEEFAIPKPQDKTVGQPTPSVAPFIGVGDKFHLKEEEKPKLIDLKDEKAPTKLDDKPKSPLGSVKAIQQEYSDDESDEEFAIPKPQDKTVGQPTPSVAPFIGVGDKSPLKEEEKPKLIDLKDEKAPTKLDDKPKSPLGSVKAIQQEYSDDESDEEFGIPKPEDKTVGQSTPSVAPFIAVGDKSPLKEEEKPKLIDVKDEKASTKLDDKPKSPLGLVKAVQQEYSDDESDEEFAIPKPQDKTVGQPTLLKDELKPTVSVAKVEERSTTVQSSIHSESTVVKAVGIIQPSDPFSGFKGDKDKSPLKEEIKPKPIELKDDKAPTKLDDKPKSPVVSVKPIQQEYSDDESDEEFAIPKPQDKTVGQPTPSVAPFIAVGDKSPLKEEEKPKLIDLKDEKAPTKLDDKPKSPLGSVKAIQQEYSDDESDEEFAIPKPQDKTLGQPTLLKDKLKPTLSVSKVEERSTTVQSSIHSESTVVKAVGIIQPSDPFSGFEGDKDKSPLKEDIKPKPIELKDDKAPTKLDDKPKSPVASVKPIQQEYSDDESDEEFAIPKPQDKTVGQPTPSVAPFIAVGDKSPLKEEEKPKLIDLKDEKASTKLDDKPKSPLDSVKAIQQEYSDDESDEEFGIPKPQDKTLGQPTLLKDELKPTLSVSKVEERSTTVQSSIHSESTVVKAVGIIQPSDPFSGFEGDKGKSPLKEDIKPKPIELKDDKAPTKLDDKPKSPVALVKPIQQEYSDDESDEEFGIPKPQDKTVGQPTPSVAPFIGVGDKSPLKEEEKPKLIDLKDEKAPTKLDDKPKSPLGSVKAIQQEYSDDESDEEFGIPKPQDKTVGQPTPSVAPFIGVGDKSPLKEEEKPKLIDLKDEKAPTKLDDKPKSPLGSVKAIQQEYSDDESDEEFRIPKPQDKTVGQPTLLKDELKPTVSVAKVEERSTTVQSSIHSESTVVKAVGIIQPSDPFSGFEGDKDKSPLKEDIKPKPIELKDDKAPTKLDDKPKSPLASVKPIQQEYSDNESDEEFAIPKPQDKTVGQPTLLKDELKPTVSVSKVEERSTTVQSSIHSESTVVKAVSIIQPSDPFSGFEDDKDKSPLKEDIKPKPIELKDDKAPTKLDDKPKSPLASVKPIQQEYSDDESDEEFVIPKPQDKTVGQPTLLKDELKPTVSVSKVEERSTTVQSSIHSESTVVKAVSIIQPSDPFSGFEDDKDKSPVKEDIKPKPIELKDDKAPTKLDDKPKSPLASVKPIQQEYSDDESDEEFAIPKPQDKTVGQPTPSVAPFIAVGDKSPLKEEEKPKLIDLKDEKASTKLDDKPKSPLGSVKAIQQEYSDDESDEEFGIPKPQDKTVGQPTPSVAPFIGVGDKSPLKEEEKPKLIDLKDEKAPTKLDDKPKSPLGSVKAIQQEYSDDESDEEFGIPKPQDKTVGQPTPSVAPFIGVGDKSPLKEEEKPKLIDLKDEKAPTKLDDKPKSPLGSVKAIQQEYDESDEEFRIPKPQDKTVGQPTLLKDELKPTLSVSKVEERSTTVQSSIHSESTVVKAVGIIQPSDPFSGFEGDKDKSPLKEDIKPKPIELKDDKAPTKLDDKPKSPLASVKPIQQEYSDDESDEEFGIPRPQDKTVGQSTPSVAPFIGVGDKSPLKEEEKPKLIDLKDEKAPTKLDDKPKSPLASVKPIQQEYSDDESDEEFAIPKPQDKTVGQPTPSVAPFIGVGDKSPLKEEEKPKLIDVKDDKAPTKLDDKPKSPLGSVKPIQQEYSDDESDEEFGIPKPQDKTVGQSTPSVAPFIGVGDKSPLKEEEKPKLIDVKDDKAPTKLDDKPKSPLGSVKPIQQEYSDDESDEEFGIPKPQDKTVGQPTLLKDEPKPTVSVSKVEERSTTVQSSIHSESTVVKAVGIIQPSDPFSGFEGDKDKSPLKEDIKPKPIELKDDKAPTKLEDKPKSPVASVKPIQQEYSDDESDEEFAIPKPQDKTVGQPTPSVAPFIGVGDKSPLKEEEKPKLIDLKDEKAPTKLDDKPKSPLGSVKAIQQEYSDDESDEEFGIPKPQDKTVGQPTLLKDEPKPTVSVSKVEERSTTVQSSIHSEITVVKADGIIQPSDPFSGFKGDKDKSPLKEDIKPKPIELKDDKAPTKLDDKPKSPLASVKPIQQEHSDDESDEEFGIPKPQDKTVGQPTLSVAPFIAVGDKSPLKEEIKPKLIDLKDEKAPTKLDDKPKSPLASVKPIQQEYSDDESDEEFAIPKPQDKTVGQPTPSVAPFIGVGDKSPLKEDEKPKLIDLKDEKAPTKLDDKPKSPLGSVKAIQQEYSDDESDEEFGIPKPQDKTVGQPTPSVAPFIGVGDKSPLKEEEKPKLIDLKDEKAPTKLDDKPKSPLGSVKAIQQEYSDDESDEEFGIPKPQDETVGQSTPSVAPFIAVGDKSPLKEEEKPKLIDVYDDKAPTKLDDKPKSPLGSVKAIQQEYSDDESDEEFAIPKPQDKTVGQPTPSVAPFIGVGDKSPLKEEEKPKLIDLKDEKAPTKLDDKPKSPLGSVKAIQQEYSDDESDEEFGIPKPQDKTVGQPTLLKDEPKPTVSVSKVEERSTTVQSSIHSEITVVKADGIIQPSDPFSGFKGDKDKSPLKEDIKPKPIELKDDKAPTKLDDKPKSPLASVKPIQQEYSDDESDEEFAIPKTQDKTVGQPTKSVAPFIGVGDKSPLKEEEKPKLIDLKDEKAPTKLDDKPKSPLGSVKAIQQEYSDDESDEKFGIPKPQDKTVGQPTPSVAAFIGVRDKYPLKDEEKPKLIDLKDEKAPTKLDDKPKSPLGSVKAIQQEYSDDESDKEFGIPKPQDKTVGQPTPSVAPFIGVGDKPSLKEEEKPKLIDLKDEKAPTKLDDKPKSPLGSVKAIQQEYSDDESDEEFGIPKPQDKTVGQPTLLKDELKPTLSVSKVEERSTTVQSSIHPESTVVKAVGIIQPSDPFSGFEGDKYKSPLKEDIKPKPIELKDDKAPTKLDDKPKSPVASVKPIQQENSDDESDEEFAIPKPQDKTVGQPTPSVAPFIAVGDKSPLKEEEKPKLIDLKDEKAPTKLDDKPKSPLGSVKAIQQEYSDDENDEEFGIPKPQDKTVGQPTPSVAAFIGVRDKYPLKDEEKPKLIDLKDEKAPTKLDDKPKSPLGSVKAIQQEYSDDESDKEFGIPKPQDKTVGQPTPSVAPFIGVGDKSPLKEEEKPKLIDLKDEKAPTKLDDKPKSPLGSVKAIQQEYSDDESDEEFGIPKPQDKTVGQPTLLKDELKPTLSVSKVEERSTTVQSSIHPESTVVKAVGIIQPSDPFSGFEGDKDKSPLKEDIKPKPIELKDDKAPTKLDDKPKSPVASVKPIQQENSDDESDEEFAIPKPQDKTVGQPTPSVAPFIAVGDKSPLKEEEKPKLIDLKDEKAPTKVDDKPKSPLGSVKAIQQEYSDDENDEEFGIPKPQDKTVGQPTPSVAAFIGVRDKYPLKDEEKPKLIDLKDEKAPTKLDDKPKSPLGSVKAIQQEYSDDESDEEFGIPKPQDKTVGQPTLLKDEPKPTVSVSKVEERSTTVQSSIHSEITVVKADGIIQPSDPISGFKGDKDKSPLKEDIKPKPIELKDDKAPTKLDDKPKSPLASVKPIQQEYSDDESDEEFGIPKPQDKTVGQPTPSVAPFIAVGDKSPLKEEIKPKLIDLKDEEAPTKLDDKPKSPLGSVKAIQQEYSDDESDEEFGIPKPQDKTVGQPTPSVAPFIGVGDKSSLKEEEKPKLIDLKDEKAPTKLDDKPKSQLGSVKAIQQEYSDDESDEEFGIPKPQDKTLGQPTLLKDELKPTLSVSKVEERSTTVQSSIHSEITVVKADGIIQPSDPFSGFKGDKDKSPLKEDIKPKPIELKDDKAPTKLDDKPKSPLASVKPIQQEYSDDESDEEFGIPKPQDKSVGQPTKFVAPFIGVGDKSPLKEEEKPKLIDLKDEKAPTKLDDKPKSPLGSVKAIQQEYSDDESDEEFGIPKPQDKTVGQPTPSVAPFIAVGDKSPLKEEEKPKLIDVKDDKALTKLDDKPKSPLGSVKAIQQEYSDDESDEEFGIPKPQDKTVGQPTLLKDELKPTLSVSKVEERSTTVQSSIHPESTVVKAVGIIQPSDPFSGFEGDKDKSPLKEDIKPKPIEFKDYKAPTKLDDKPKSPLGSVKAIQQEYSDDESDEEFGIPKPHEKTVGRPTPSIAAFIGVRDKYPLKEEEKPKLVDVKDDKAPTKLDDKPKSPLGSVKAIQQEYSDDESDEEFAIPKPQDKTVGQPTPSVAAFIGVRDKYPLKEEEKSKLVDVKDDKAPTKLDDKPRSPLGLVKAIQQEYSDDESDEEFATPKPQDKTVGQPTLLKNELKPTVSVSKVEERSTIVQSSIHSESTVVKAAIIQPSDPFSGFESDKDKSPLKEYIKPMPIELKDDEAPTKLDEKPKSPLASVKPIQQEYSDDESDEDFAIPKTQDKTVGHPTPSVAPFIGVGDKSPLKEEEKPKLIDVNDDKAPTKLDDKPKSPLGSVKAIQQEYSDDESDEEFAIPKPQDKTVGQPTPSVAPFIGVGDKSPLKVEEKPKLIDVKDDKAPTKLDDKPKSPLGSVKAIQQEYSDDESDEEFGIPKPQDKTVGQPTFLKDELKPTFSVSKVEERSTTVQSSIHSESTVVKAVGIIQPSDPFSGFEGDKDKSPLKEDIKPKPIELKDDKAPTKLDDKPKSPLDSVKPIQQEYSDDESDEEFSIPKPQDKTVGQPTPSVAPFIAVGDKSPLKEEEKPKLIDLKDEKASTKLDDKPKSPLGSVKAIQQEYSDDENDEEFGIPKPQDKTVGQPTPSVAPFIGVGDKSLLKEEIKPSVSISKVEDSSTTDQSSILSESTVVKAVGIIQPSDPFSGFEGDKDKSSLKQDIKPKPIELKEDKASTKLDDKPKSSVASVKPIQQEYSDDESDEEFAIPKPQDKTVGQPTPSVAPFIAVGDKSPLKEEEKPKLIDLKDEKASTKLDDKPKSPLGSVKAIQQEYSDDESDEEFGIPKPQDKTVGPPTPSVAPFIGVGDKSLLKENIKPSVSISKIEDSSTTDQSSIHSESTVVKAVGIIQPSDPFSGFEGDKDKSPLKEDIKPKPIELKDDKAPTKLDDKPKSPLDSVKPIQQEYSDVESDEEFGIPKPQDKTVGQPTLSVATFIGDGDKTLKEEDKPKPIEEKREPLVRSFSPQPKTKKSEKITVKQTKTTATRSTKELTVRSSKKTERFGIQEHMDTKRSKTPTPIAAHRYMQPTLAHNMRFGLSGDGETGQSVSPTPAPHKSPAPPKSPAPALTRSTQRTHLKTSALTKSSSLETKQKKPVPEKTPTQPRSQIKRGSQSDSKESLKSTDRLYKRQTSKENKLANVIGSKSQATKSMKTQSATAATTLAYRTSIESDNKLQKKTTATIQRTKVPISVSSSARTAAKLSKSDDAEKRPQIDNKKTVRRVAAKTSEIPGTSATKSVPSSIEPKMQKKMKDTMNESNSNSGSGSTSASGSSNSTRRSVRSVSTVSSRKTDKDLTNIRRAAGAVVSTSTVRAHREPTATTGAVSTVLVDDDCEVITIRSIKSSDSTKSSTSSSSGSGSNSRKVLTSEVFTKTFGPDRPLEVVYRQPEFDVEHHTIMSVRPPSNNSGDQQRCLNEFDVSFIDTTDSSLSDSVALPMFGSSDPERLLAASPGSPKPTRSPLALIEETLRRQQQQQHHHHHQQHHHSSIMVAGAAALDPSLPIQGALAESQREAAVTVVTAEMEVEKGSTLKGKYGSNNEDI
ncbi:microtubule-associated protein futsch-like [Drosophila kikkawai]|uniref:Microtubule-associated protein futsch-like n=1 Tax=Drosophila kikkawai TaxID=30033 RepID=A0ABM4GEB1_DROKI